MTIAIDCRMIDASGIGVYLRGCLPWFLQSGNSLLLMGNAVKLNSFAANPDIQIINCNIKPFSIKELLFFSPKKARQINKADAYFSPFFNIPHGIKIPVYTTLHDIIFPDIPELSSKVGLAVRMWFYSRAYKKSKKIFTVSQFSKSRIEHHLGTEKPVVVTHSAIQPMFLNFRSHNQNVPKNDTIVFIGNIKKHKGLDCLLDAFQCVRDEGLHHRLVIIGSKENFRTTDNTIMGKTESICGDAISFTGFVSDEQLMEHLAAAALLVQPSLYEGFCLPPLEAMVLGTHALISDIPVLKEVYAEYPVTFFRAGDSADLKEKMLKLLLDIDTSKKNPYPTLSKEQLSKYTFEKTASTILRELP